MEKFINKKVWEEARKSLQEISNKCFGDKFMYYKVIIIFNIYNILIDTIDVSDEELEKLTNFIYEMYISISNESISIDDLVDDILRAYEDKKIKIDDIIKMTKNEFLQYILNDED